MQLWGILNELVPVFFIIGLGVLFRRIGLLPVAFVEGANRLVYFVAIPVLIFQEVSRGGSQGSLDTALLGAVLAAVVSTGALALLIAVSRRLSAPMIATFTQTSCHGNLSYLGLAVVFYVLGSEGLGAAGVLAGCLILAQNILSVGLFLYFPGTTERFSRLALRQFAANPIILATALGLLAATVDLTLPPLLGRSIRILGEMALPLALLIIGGSLRPVWGGDLTLVGLSSLLKLVVLPSTGFVLLRLLGAETQLVVTAVILLGSPSATISYLMAAEMGGDRELAAAAVTASTLLSLPTYSVIILIARG